MSVKSTFLTSNVQKLYRSVQTIIQTNVDKKISLKFKNEKVLFLSKLRKITTWEVKDSFCRYGFLRFGKKRQKISLRIFTFRSL